VRSLSLHPACGSTKICSNHLSSDLGRRSEILYLQSNVVISSQVLDQPAYVNFPTSLKQKALFLQGNLDCCIYLLAMSFTCACSPQITARHVIDHEVLNIRQSIHQELVIRITTDRRPDTYPKRLISHVANARMNGNRHLKSSYHLPVVCSIRLLATLSRIAYPPLIIARRVIAQEESISYGPFTQN